MEQLIDTVCENIQALMKKDQSIYFWYNEKGLFVRIFTKLDHILVPESMQARFLNLAYTPAT